MMQRVLLSDRCESGETDAGNLLRAFVSDRLAGSLAFPAPVRTRPRKLWDLFHWPIHPSRRSPAPKCRIAPNSAEYTPWHPNKVECICWQSRFSPSMSLLRRQETAQDCRRPLACFPIPLAHRPEGFFRIGRTMTSDPGTSIGIDVLRIESGDFAVRDHLKKWV